MRLIDADALETAIDKKREILIEQGRPGAEHIVVHHARRLIEEAPTVDAIPVEWIEKEYQRCVKYGDGVSAAYRWLITCWRKEQEAR